MGDKPGVGAAQVFISHVQVEPIHDTLRHLDGSVGTLWWLDYVILRQCQAGQFSPNEIAAVVHSIANTIAAIDDDSVYFGRLFCIFELAATPTGALTMRMSDQQLINMSTMSGSQNLLISSSTAKCRHDEDTQQITSTINELGGHVRL